MPNNYPQDLATMMLDKIHKIRGMCQVVDLWPLPGSRGYKLFSCSTQLNLNFQLSIKAKMLKNKEFSCFQTLNVVYNIY